MTVRVGKQSASASICEENEQIIGQLELSKGPAELVIELTETVDKLPAFKELTGIRVQGIEDVAI